MHPHRRMVALAAAAAALVATGPAARAAELIVDQQAGPFRTISAAVAEARAGDTVLVSPGVYRESVVLKTSGAPGSPIVLRSKVPHEAVVCGSDVVTQWTPVEPGIWSAPSATKRIPHERGNGEWVYVDGAPLERAATPQQLTPGTFYQDFDGQRLLVAAPEGRDIADLKVEYAHRIGLIYAGSPGVDDVHVIGFTLTHNGAWFRGNAALVVSGRRWLAEDNHVRWSSYSGVGISRSSDAVVRNNLIEWNGNAGFAGSLNHRMLVERNTVRHNNWRRISTNFEGGGSKWTFSIDCTVRDNVFAYNHGWGIWFDIANTGVIYDRNVTHDNSVCGLFTEINWGTLIRDNVTFNNQYGIVVGESCETLVERNVAFNNGTGVRMRGDYRRGVEPGDEESIAKVRQRVATMPGLDPTRLELYMAQYRIYAATNKAWMLNNNLIVDNLLFDNHTNYYEHRDYAAPSAIDPFVNSNSDRNVFWSADPSKSIAHSAGSYADLAAWQNASGRDRASTFADPRDSATKLPAWAEAKRSVWQLPLRPRREIDALRLSLVESPSACELRGRLYRAARIERVTLDDPQVRAVAYEAGGVTTLALWTTQPTDRRVVRVRFDGSAADVENGYGVRSRPAPRNGAVELVASLTPTYVHNVTLPLAEQRLATLDVESFQAPGNPVAVRATFANGGDKPLPVKAAFSASPGFSVDEPAVARTVPPGQSAEFAVKLTPDGSVRSGHGRVRLEADVGDERLTRVASFNIGESGGSIPMATSKPLVGPSRENWPATPPLAVISDANQYVSGDKSSWSGPADMSAKVFAAWTPTDLYLSAVVADDVVVPATAGGKPWDFDSVEFFIDGRSGEMQFQRSLTEGCYQIGVSAAEGDDTPVTAVLAPGHLTGLQARASIGNGGYTVTVRVPLTATNFPAGGFAEGRPVRLSVQVNDRDDPARPRDAVFGWAVSPSGKNYQDASGWRTLVLGR